MCRMPSLTVTPTKIANPPRKSGPPPDLALALEFLFLLWEQRNGEPAPTPGWFLLEAFSALQTRNFKPSPPLQHFLQSFLGPAYCGAEAVETYYLVVAFAMIVKGVYTDQLAMGTCRWCLMQWGIRERRDAIDQVTEKWRRRVLEVWSTMPAGQGPNEFYERGFRLLDVMRFKGPTLVKKIQGILRE
jgi:hypothetical protein